MMSRTSRRNAFTLLELLVVIAMMMTLAGLLLGAVMKVWVPAEELEARQEISGMHNAILAFCNDARFGMIGYIPSKFDPSGNDPLSSVYIRRVFPRIGGLNMPRETIEGSECLVLFLSGPNNKGWSTDPLDPTSTYGNRIRFYEFKPERLQDVRGKGYMSYLDRWGTPYAFFSSRREAKTWEPNSYSNNDCQSLGVFPYVNANRQGFQIISAGRDRQFGTKGSTWTENTAPGDYPPDDPGHDDLSNFVRKNLGSRQQ
jgi:type II secretory pathway pseudopilin PulG